MRTLKLALAGIVIAGSPLAVAPAWAACVPACTDGQVCRYEAAGGTFYCQTPPGSADKDDEDKKGISRKKPVTLSPGGGSKPLQTERK